MFWAIGDVHGNVPSYEAICARLHKEDPDAITFQVGDMGVGFAGVNMPKVGLNDYFIAGNHDDSLVCAHSPHFLGDFGCRVIGEKKVFWLGGAFSTDRQYRTEGKNWWAYEELSMQQLSEAVALFELEKPEIVITHDCPMQIREKWFEHRNFNRTVQAMTAMFHNHQPESWCFGHHHRFVEEKIDGTNFMCLAELQSKKIGSQKVYLGEDEP